MLHTNTKTIKSAYHQYLKSDLYNLYDCYTSYSKAKFEAFDYCKELTQKHFGKGGKIITFNTNMFTFGFIGEVKSEKTNELKKAFFYITKNYNRYILIEELGE